MNAIELIQANRLTEARAQLIADVNASPADAGKRVLLFEVLCFCGDYRKAEQHLDLLVGQDLAGRTSARVYKALLAAERERSEVAVGAKRPHLLGPAPPYLEAHFVARAQLQAGDIARAARYFRELEAESGALCGTANRNEFQGFQDSDAMLAPFLEIFIHDRYLWLPFRDLRELSVAPPHTLLDLLWAPAQLSTWQGITTSCFLPVLYPATYGHPDDMVRLGKMTDWRELGGGIFRGAGQHVFLAGDEELALLDIRELRFLPPAESEEWESDLLAVHGQQEGRPVTCGARP
ncbi:MAG TPA: type VI secretion system accessory protein TagJ [Geomonas sp.]|nr:type VI secretion system accessory protein TagJ [Geomonas sp.]